LILAASKKWADRPGFILLEMERVQAWILEIVAEDPRNGEVTVRILDLPFLTAANNDLLGAESAPKQDDIPIMSNLNRNGRPIS
jgi:hypothetical protein